MGLLNPFYCCAQKQSLTNSKQFVPPPIAKLDAVLKRGYPRSYVPNIGWSPQFIHASYDMVSLYDRLSHRGRFIGLSLERFLTSQFFGCTVVKSVLTEEPQKQCYPYRCMRPYQ